MSNPDRAKALAGRLHREIDDMTLPELDELLLGELDAATQEAVERCAVIASQFSVKEGRSIHPDIPWENMTEAVQMTAHTTAQQISWAIRESAGKG